MISLEEYLRTLTVPDVDVNVDDCRVLLLCVPEGGLRDSILAALGEAAGAFGDNGGDPDGSGLLLAPVCAFGSAELSRADRAGAGISWGYWFPYPPELWHAIEGKFCAYQAAEVGYTLSRSVAESAWERFRLLARRTGEEAVRDDGIGG